MPREVSHVVSTPGCGAWMVCPQLADSKAFRNWIDVWTQKYSSGVTTRPSDPNRAAQAIKKTMRGYVFF